MSTGRLKGLLAKHEGIKPKVYDDANGQPIVPGYVVVGHPTIAIGVCLDLVGLTIDEIYYLTQNRINIAITECDKYPWFKDLEDVRQDALIDLMYAEGAPHFAEFKQMFACIQKKDYHGAGQEIINSRWGAKTGQRAIDLAKMLETNSY